MKKKALTLSDMDPEIRAVGEILHAIKGMTADSQVRLLMAVHLIFNIPVSKPMQAECFVLTPK